MLRDPSFSSLHADIADLARKVQATSDTNDDILFRFTTMQEILEDLLAKISGAAVDLKPGFKKERGIDGWKLSLIHI